MCDRSCSSCRLEGTYGVPVSITCNWNIVANNIWKESSCVTMRANSERKCSMSLFWVNKHSIGPASSRTHLQGYSPVTLSVHMSSPDLDVLPQREVTTFTLRERFIGHGCPWRCSAGNNCPIFDDHHCVPSTSQRTPRPRRNFVLLFRIDVFVYQVRCHF
jgi:hypothetical protein